MAFFEACTPSPQRAVEDRVQRLLSSLEAEHQTHHPQWLYAVRLYYRYGRAASQRCMMLEDDAQNKTRHSRVRQTAQRRGRPCTASWSSLCKASKRGCTP